MALNKELDGKYKAKVTDAVLGVIGEKGTVALTVLFSPFAELIGAEFKEGVFARVNKPYWLTDKVISQGKAAGKTVIEMARENIKEAYGYEGPLEIEAIKAAIVGKEVELQCKPDGRGYTDVQFVNPPGGGARKGFKVKDVPVDRLAQIAAAWSGKSAVEKPIDPKDLFAKMTDGAA